jgi:hypothetical protein
VRKKSKVPIVRIRKKRKKVKRNNDSKNPTSSQHQGKFSIEVMSLFTCLKIETEFTKE